MSVALCMYSPEMNLVLKSERLLLRLWRKRMRIWKLKWVQTQRFMRHIGGVETKDEIVREMAKYTKRCAGGWYWSLVRDRSLDE